MNETENRLLESGLAAPKANAPAHDVEDGCHKRQSNEDQVRVHAGSIGQEEATFTCDWHRRLRCTIRRDAHLEEEP